MNKKKPTICIGVTVYNSDQYLKKSLDKLIQQTYLDFKIIIVNDGSEDQSAVILSEYEKKDKRISVFTFEKRVGMIDAWRKAVQLADKRYKPDYFAWYSDHDYVELNWLEMLLNEFDGGDNDIVCVYPKTVKVDIEGNVHEEIAIKYDSSQMERWQRIEEAAVGYLGSGDVIYGLFKMQALRSCGYFRKELFPDRLLVSEIQLHGSIKYTTETVRYRRVIEYPTEMSEVISRQEKNLFNPSNKRTNPVISHVTSFLRGTTNIENSMDKDFLFIKMLHAWLYFTRNTVKFQKFIVQEAQKGAKMPKIDNIREYLLFKNGQNGMVLKRDFASLRKKYRRKIDKIKKEKQEIEMALLKNNVK
jgi:glycosyltransferase involved in cell wall biosynthesis